MPRTLVFKAHSFIGKLYLPKKSLFLTRTWKVLSAWQRLVHCKKAIRIIHLIQFQINFYVLIYTSVPIYPYMEYTGLCESVYMCKRGLCVRIVCSFWSWFIKLAFMRSLLHIFYIKCQKSSKLCKDAREVNKILEFHFGEYIYFSTIGLKK